MYNFFTNPALNRMNYPNYTTTGDYSINNSAFNGSNYIQPQIVPAPAVAPLNSSPVGVSNAQGSLPTVSYDDLINNLLGNNGVVDSNIPSYDSLLAQSRQIRSPLDDYSQSNRSTWTGADWSKIAGTGVQLLGSLGSLWMQNKGYKLAKQQMADQTALNRANYRMQAKAWNNSQRDIASGRGLAVMSSSQKSALGRQARGRLVEESY